MTGHITYHNAAREAEQHAHETLHPLRELALMALVVLIVMSGALWSGSYGDGWQFEEQHKQGDRK